MTILSRYIGVTVIKLTLLVFLVVLGVEFFILVIDQFGDIGSGSYGLWKALAYVVLVLPNNIYSLFPMIGLLGSLLGLGSMAAASELVVMRTAGVSVWRVISAVLGASLILIILMSVLGEYVGPMTQQWADQEKLASESQGQAIQSASGLWFKTGNQFINVKVINPDHSLEDVTEYTFDEDSSLVMSLHAQSATVSHGQWTLHQVNQSLFSPTRITLRTVDQMPWNIQINARSLGISKNTTNEMNLSQLIKMIRFRQVNGLSTAEYSLAFWQRCLQPVASIVMIFLAIPFIFGPLRSVTMGVRIITGAVVGFTFYLLNQFFGPFSLVYQIPPLIGACLPIILFVALGVILMRRVR